MQAKRSSKGNKKLQAEAKLLVIIVLHCLVAFYTSIVSSLTLWKTPEFKADLFTYFSCEAKGILPGKPCLKVDYGSYTIATLIPYVWISNIATINAIYVLNILDVKTKVKNFIVTKICLK